MVNAYTVRDTIEDNGRLHHVENQQASTDHFDESRDGIHQFVLTVSIQPSVITCFQLAFVGAGNDAVNFPVAMVTAHLCYS